MKPLHFFFFFFNDTATTEIYTLSLHDALPISEMGNEVPKEPLMFLKPPSSIIGPEEAIVLTKYSQRVEHEGDRKSTRLNSSRSQISYAVFCLKKKKQNL